MSPCFSKMSTQDGPAQNCIVVYKMSTFKYCNTKCFRLIRWWIPHIYNRTVMLIQWLNHTHTRVVKHIWREAKVQQPHTHTLHRIKRPPAPPPQTRLNRSALWCHYFVSVMPEARETSPWAVTGNDNRGVTLWDNCASGIINMDGRLTLRVQLICVSIPLAAVQTSPGFTVHWLLQNYSSM